MGAALPCGLRYKSHEDKSYACAREIPILLCRTVLENVQLENKLPYLDACSAMCALQLQEQGRFHPQLRRTVPGEGQFAEDLLDQTTFGRPWH